MSRRSRRRCFSGSSNNRRRPAHTPITTDVGEAMVFKYALDHQEALDDAYLAAVVDQVLLPAVGLPPHER